VTKGCEVAGWMRGQQSRTRVGRKGRRGTQPGKTVPQPRALNPPSPGVCCAAPGGEGGAAHVLLRPRLEGVVWRRRADAVQVAIHGGHQQVQLACYGGQGGGSKAGKGACYGVPRGGLLRSRHTPSAGCTRRCDAAPPPRERAAGGGPRPTPHRPPHPSTPSPHTVSVQVIGQHLAVARLAQVQAVGAAWGQAGRQAPLSDQRWCGALSPAPPQHLLLLTRAPSSWHPICHAPVVPSIT
jgi:hypothetical protein